MKFSVIFAFLSLSIASSFSIAQDQHQHESPHKPLSAVESLSPDLRELLSKEMLALQEGMKSVIPAYVSGNWNEIESIALKMKNSYIMKQSLNVEQREELHTSLPESFIQQDKQFHYLAGMLNHAAKNKKTELVGFYFSQLSNACVGCHTQFATHKFPAFVNPEDQMHKH